MNSKFAKISSRENISNSLFAKFSSRENQVLYSIGFCNSIRDENNEYILPEAKKPSCDLQQWGNEKVKLTTSIREGMH